MSKPTFNYQHTMNIKWAKWSWNPFTGCKYGCPYCYARDMALRLHGHFEPTFHEKRLMAPYNTKIPKSKVDLPGIRYVFLGSMTDFFGDPFIPAGWINRVLEVVEKTPQWIYLILTKEPERVKEFHLPANVWIGTTVDRQKRVARATWLVDVEATVKFISVEPMLEKISFVLPHTEIHGFPPPSTFGGLGLESLVQSWKKDDVVMSVNTLQYYDWLIVGGQSRTRQCPAFQPEWEWVESLMSEAREEELPVFWKPNLMVRPEEYPEEVTNEATRRDQLRLL